MPDISIAAFHPTPQGLSEERYGRIDLVCCGRLGIRRALLAIQVDSSDRQRSLDKLILMKARGFTPVWVRWKTRSKLSIPDGVLHIQLSDRTG